jgi:biopolymer transport protein ExbD
MTWILGRPSHRAWSLTCLGLATALFAAPICAAQVLRAGVSVELAVTSYAVPMPGADNQDSLVVAVTDDGNVYVEVNRIAPGALADELKRRLANQRENRFYIKADARTPYADVGTVLEAARTAGIEAPILLTAQRELEPGRRGSLDGLEVFVGPPLPSGAESTVVQVLTSGQQSPTLTINNEQIAWATLPSTLGLLFQSRSEKVVLVKADGRSRFAHVVQAIDLCRSTGAKVILALPGV